MGRASEKLPTQLTSIPHLARAKAAHVSRTDSKGGCRELHWGADSGRPPATTRNTAKRAPLGRAHRTAFAGQKDGLGHKNTISRKPIPSRKSVRCEWRSPPHVIDYTALFSIFMRLRFVASSWSSGGLIPKSRRHARRSASQSQAADCTANGRPLEASRRR